MSESRLENDLERKIYQAILDFPERIDVMETRNEESVRVLARRLARLVREETARNERV